MNKFIKFSIILILSPTLLFANGEREDSRQTTIAPSTNKEVIQTNMNNLVYLYQVIDALSINEIDNDKALEGMASSLLDALGDEYSFYVTEKDADTYEEQSTGIYAGIGTYLTKKTPQAVDANENRLDTDYFVKVSSPFPEDTADRAGLKANDFITHIDGESVNQLSATESSLKLRGELVQMLLLLFFVEVKLLI